MRGPVGWALVLGVATLATLGCNRAARPSSNDPSSVRDADSRTNRTAVRSIAAARCEREERCGNIGVDAKFASQDACLERVRADWADELSARECPAGVRDGELKECIEDIRGEDCGSPLDSLQRMFSCGAAEICADT
jgi:hypothetical protein